MVIGLVLVDTIWTKLGTERAKALQAFITFLGRDNAGRFFGWEKSGL